jgi:hypothetical protein
MKKFLIFTLFTWSYSLSATDISSSSGLTAEDTYSINFLWLNKKDLPAQTYIAPGDEEAFYNRNVRNVADWSRKNPKATIHLWYGDQNIAPESVANTRELLDREGNGNIILRNVKELPEVKDHLDVFSPDVSVYFRADLARVVILHSLMISRESTYAIYADFDVPALDENDLFDIETLEKLNKYGLVLPEDKHTSTRYENSFHMVSHQNQNMLK